MSMPYTDRLSLMKNIIDSLELQGESVDEINASLKQLRKYSDIAQIIANAKNPSAGLYGENTPKVERQQFETFRFALSQTQNKLIELVQKEKARNIDNTLKDIFAGKKDVSALPFTVNQENKKRL